jgi:hypothetical protein
MEVLVMAKIVKELPEEQAIRTTAARLHNKLPAPTREDQE